MGLKPRRSPKRSSPLPGDESHSVFAVTAERIKSFTDLELIEFTDHLLRAELALRGGDLSKVIVSKEAKANDDGCDAFSPANDGKSAFLKGTEVCFQFKAGVAGIPSRLKNEVTKPIPRQVLKAGGWFVLIASAASGKRGIDNRLRTLRAEAKRAGLPTSRIGVLVCEQLANWCNTVPAVAARWASRPSGLISIEQWERDPRHSVEYAPSAVLADAATKLASTFSPPAGSTHHIHIHGRAGVGKTRFALQLCRSASWRELVVFFPQPPDARLTALIGSIAMEPNTQLVVVVDEAQKPDIRLLNEYVRSAGGRLRAITIGTSTPDETDFIDVFVVQPLADLEISRIVQKLHPGMPIEQADWVARLSDGYVKFAKLAANALAKTPALTTLRLFSSSDVKALMDGMLGTGDRRSLHVAAVLRKVGWYGPELDLEGKTIADLLDLNWSSVQHEVQQADSNWGIAPKGGRYRYVSPHPLAVFLAIESWDTYGTRLRDLGTRLPSDAARERFEDRIGDITDHPVASKIAEEELDAFFLLADFVSPGASRRWKVFSPAHPSLAASRARAALTSATESERRQIPAAVRRDLVHGLVELCRSRETFDDATLALAELAQAETESWANNATAEFAARFQVGLSGTSVPYPNRLTVIDTLIGKGDGYLLVAIRALRNVGYLNNSGSHWSAPATGPHEPDWCPANHQEQVAARRAGLARLIQLVTTVPAAYRDELGEAIELCAELLLFDDIREDAAALFRTASEEQPILRERLRRAVKKQIEFRAKKESVKTFLQQVHDELVDNSLEGRLAQFVGTTTWETNTQDNIQPLVGLAQHFAASPDELAAHLPWLTSGDAASSWLFGELLAAADSALALPNILTNRANLGEDLRIVAGYFNRQREIRSPEWMDKWLDSYPLNEREDAHLIFEITARCRPTERGTARLTEIIRTRQLTPAVVSLVAFAPYPTDAVSPKAFLCLASALAGSTDYRETALPIVERRLEEAPAELDGLLNVALTLCTDVGLIRAGHMTEYYWHLVALALVPSSAIDLARAIFAAHAASGGPRNWFLSHADHVLAVLRRCITRDPTGAWNELRPHLEADPARYAIAFPEGLVDSLPPDEVMSWIADAPYDRAPLIARLSAKAFESSNTLACRLLNDYGDLEFVEAAFFSSYISGTYVGSVSDHWLQLADNLETAKNANLPGVRKWATRTAAKLVRMAKAEREREDEEDF